MRAILIFNLPKEENDFKIALAGSDFYSIIYTIQEMVYNYLRKKNDKYKNAEELLEDILKICNEVVFRIFAKE